METLQSFLVSGVFAFIMIFVRLGTAIMILPGVGDSFVPNKIRLYIALGITLMLTPLVSQYVPRTVPPMPMLFALITMEFIIGLLVGTIARTLMAALDTAGMVVSLTSGLANAQLFNPVAAGQGSLVGAFLSVTGVTVLMAADFHHFLFYGLVQTYKSFPVGSMPDTGSMAELLSQTIAASFLMGVQIATPFLILAMLIYIGMGVLSRVMPQIQVFLIAIPLQILLSMMTLSLVLSAGYLFWLSKFKDHMTFLFTISG